MLGASYPYRSAEQAFRPVQLGLRRGCPIWAARFAGCSHCLGKAAKALQGRQATGPVAPAISCATGNRAPADSPRLALTLAQGPHRALCRAHLQLNPTQSQQNVNNTTEASTKADIITAALEITDTQAAAIDQLEQRQLILWAIVGILTVTLAFKG